MLAPDDERGGGGGGSGFGGHGGGGGGRRQGATKPQTAGFGNPAGATPQFKFDKALGSVDISDYVILSDQRERRISFLNGKFEILRRYAAQNDM